MADRRPLMKESSDLSETFCTPPVLPSLGFSLGFGDPLSSHLTFSPQNSPPLLSPPGYPRLRSGNTEGGAQDIIHEHEEEYVAVDSLQSRASGLGIATSSTAVTGISVVESPNSSPPTLGNRRVSIQVIPRVPVGFKSPLVRSPSIGTSTPNTGNPLLSSFPHDSSARSTPDLRRDRAGFSPRDEGSGDYEQFKKGVLKSTRSTQSLQSINEYQQYLQTGDTERLRKKMSSPSIRSAYDNDFHPTEQCPTTRDFYISRWSWLYISLIILCLFSTVFSGMFLVIAIRGPKWGRTITSHGSLRPSDAATLTSIMAKLIELSFVTSFVAFLGQVLSRRAFMKEQGRGITLAEMSMWRWVVQPGTLITHWETARYAGVTVLGILSLLSAFLATMYAPASTALVQPSLRFGSWEPKLLAGQVKTSFSNMNYMESICESPIRTDDIYKGSTCLQIEHAANGYHNYQRYLSFWNTASNNGNGTKDQRTRPPGFAMMYENTSVTPAWINVVDTKALSKKYNRAVNSVSLAYPHSGVFQAARDGRNRIIQPEELDGMGIYSLRASVPSPVMNVLCANLNRDELKPIVYKEWTEEPVNITSWPLQAARLDATTLNNDTVVDELFGWTKQGMYDRPPVFAKIPEAFNTIMNHTSYPWGRDAIYLLGAGGADTKSNRTGEYVLCQLKVSMTPHCSTRYNATSSGGTMEAICEQENDEFAYIKSYTNATGVAKVPDWRDVGFDWANSLSLNTGIMDGAASNSRLLTQLMLQKDASGEYDLSLALPSPAEALAVMSGCTLLMSAQDSPFVDFWNYTVPTLETPSTQYFNASILEQQYASGSADTTSRAFIPVLLLVFLMNIFVLLYFLFHHGLVTDFSEPPNLFTLAVNSPPSHLLKGSCGGGPEGKQFVVNWFVNTEGDHLYMEPGIVTVEQGHGQGQGQGQGQGHGTPHMHHHVHRQAPRNEKSVVKGAITRIQDGVTRLRERGLGLWKARQPLMRPVSVAKVPEFELEEQSMNGYPRRMSRARRQYTELAQRRSML
ncbi:hypothetical protein GQ43DRAFT_16992 [Delitschia confertaspora ATCC 74209]|uniref:Uncharacterized protein n=1 Tax=Delitschia confertaspora ATCC 74209 TaxID=1513339 RepID=A0A9P4JRN8_9PLEO|nr:hypothetical protein GQ43DRAFT_16992 [Delitschia confertaspora ATCC 74209]